MKIHYSNMKFSAANPSGLLDVLFEYAIVILQGFRRRGVPLCGNASRLDQKISCFATCFSLG